MPRAAKTAPAPHPVDVRRAEVLATCVAYTATIRANGGANTLRVVTLRDAARAAASLEEGAAAVYGTSNRASVYAIPADGGRGEIVDPQVWRALVPETERAAIRAGIQANLRKIAS